MTLAQAQAPEEPLAAAQRLEVEAVKLLNAGRVAEAAPLLHKSADMWELASGPYTRYFYRALGNLQSVYFRLQRYGDMLAVMERRLDVARTLFGERHEQTILCMRNLAGAYEALGRHGEARRMRENAEKLKQPG